MRDFTEGDILGQVISFSFPLLLGNFLQAFSSMINIFFVGRLLGHHSIAAITTSMPIVFFLLSGIIGLNMATNIIVAQAYGSKNIKLMEKVFANSLLTNLFLCVVVSLTSIAFSGRLLDLVNTPPEIKAEAHSFLVVVLMGIVFQFAYNWYAGTLRGLGDAKTPLYILILTTALNLLFIPSLILGLGPFPKMGILGAPTANIFANLIGLIVGYLYTIRISPFFSVHEWDFTLEWNMIKKIFTIGIPTSLQMVITSFAATIITYLVNGFGTDVIAAYGIGIQADQLAFLPSMSIGIAISSMVGQNLGIGKYDRVNKILRYSISLSVSIALLFFLVIFTMSNHIGSIFTGDPVVIGHTVSYYRIVSFSYVCFALIFSLQGVVRASGDTMAMLILTVISIVIFRIPLAYYLSEYTNLKESGIWLAILISSFVAVTINYLYYKSGRWKTMKVIHAMSKMDSA